MDNFWKNKKVIAYVALLHHTRFIIPVMEKLSSLGADVRYIVAQAERSQEITAVECKLNYSHIFDYLGPGDYEDIQKNYLRERKAFTRAMTMDFAMATQMITVTDKTLYASAQEYVGFRNLLRDEKPDLCFALHEVNRWGKMYAFWAKKFNTPFITLQEGLGYDENYGYIGHVQYSTLDLVWGERIKKKFSDYEAPIERIIPVGNTHISREKRYQKKNNIREKIRKKLKLNHHFVPLLLFSVTPPEKEKLLPLIKTVADQDHLKLIIKFHPASKFNVYEAWKAAIPKKLQKKLIFVHGEEGTYDLISASDLCVLARPSTTGIESIALGKPLVQLDLASPVPEPYSFVDQKVALEMTPEALAGALAEKFDFPGAFGSQAIQLFLKNELTQTTGATARIMSIMEKAIKAVKKTKAPALSPPPSPAVYDWSFIIPVPENAPDEFLFQLESLSVNSEGQGNFEVILIEPETISPKTVYVLDSLKGDITRIKTDAGQNFFTMVNTGAWEAAKGDKLVVFSELACPRPNWLKALSKGFARWGDKKIFGGKIINRFNNIVHAGMVLNTNNAPVSAYLHLDSRFPQANQERPFQMIDHLVACSRSTFRVMGGFSPETGSNAFMDFCLKAGKQTEDTCIYLPGLEILKKHPGQPQNHDHAIQFYARWHGVLWSSEDRLYEKDGISSLQLDAARMTRAQELARRI